MTSSAHAGKELRQVRLFLGRRYRNNTICRLKLSGIRCRDFLNTNRRCSMPERDTARPRESTQLRDEKNDELATCRHSLMQAGYLRKHIAAE